MNIIIDLVVAFLAFGGVFILSVAVAYLPKKDIDLTVVVAMLATLIQTLVFVGGLIYLAT